MSQDEWELFGSDSEDDDDDGSSTPTSNFTNAQVGMNETLEQAIDATILHTTQVFIKSNRGVQLTNRYFGMVAANDELDIDAESLFRESLSKKTIQRGMNIYSPMETLNQDIEFACDGAAIYRNFQVCSETCSDERLLRKHLIPGGFLIVVMYIAKPDAKDITASSLLSMWKHQDGTFIFLDTVWDLKRAEIIHSGNSHDQDGMYTVQVTKRPCTLNMASCVWKSNSKRVPSAMYATEEKREETWLQYEQRILSEVTLTRTVAELNCQYSKSSHDNDLTQSKSPVLTKENKQQAVDSLKKHGFVIIPRLFMKPSVRSWAKAILSDFDDAKSILLERDNVDILDPGKEGSRDPLSYKEMAMREDLRVDLRDGPSMLSLRESEGKSDSQLLKDSGYGFLNETISRSINPSVIVDNSHEFNDVQSIGQSIRFNPEVLQIVQSLLNPKENKFGPRAKSGPPLHKGNFGRWNFQGSGPNGSNQNLRVGNVAAVISLPGAADQAIHADTTHLFEHNDCLPCHYAHVFSSGLDERDLEMVGKFDSDGNFTGDSDVGSTAFVHGSHRLSVTARLTGENVGEPVGGPNDEMHVRIIRPSLQLGDVLIFDTRILHFGLANQSNKIYSEKSIGIRRPMIYMNMTSAWFNDPKNWDDKKEIFHN